ncbi:MAG: hypothetical protein ABIH23_01205 [bacterium]
MTRTVNTKTSQQSASRICWQGKIESVQCRAWVWRYKTDNRTHHHLGFNLFLKGEANEREGRFIVAVSDTQHAKLQFHIGDVFKGTDWPCIKAKHDVADYYRAGGFRVVSRTDEEANGPPFTGLLPPIEVFQRRGARMLNANLWRKQCFSCMWANKSAVEIEYKFGKVKRYRKETFCYGHRSCPLYEMGPPRQMPYFDTFPSIDEGWIDDLCTEQRGEED